jgi:hypothetical protein
MAAVWTLCMPSQLGLSTGGPRLTCSVAWTQVAEAGAERRSATHSAVDSVKRETAAAGGQELSNRS